MVFNFRKIASVLASAVMVGSSVAVAAAEIYPAPFVKNGDAPVQVVIGSRAQPTDMVAISDITVSLSDALSAQTATVNGDTSPSATATGGDSVFLSTTTRALRFKDAINVATPTLTSSDMPTLLADGKFTDARGTEHSYTQSITVGSQVTSDFGLSGGDLKDPELYLDVGYSPSSVPLYNYTLSFTNRNLNVSDATNVQGRSIKIMGTDYVVGTSSTNSTLYLNGAGQTMTLNGGDTANFTIGGVAHTITLETTESATVASISVDGGDPQSVTESYSYSFAGGLNVYVKDVIYPTFAGRLERVTLLVGANTLKLTNGQTAKYGPDETSIRGSYVKITPASTGTISGLSVSVAMAKSELDHLGEGDTFVDPVFGGLKVQFAGASPGLNSSARATIIAETDNNQYAKATFTPYIGGTEQTLTYAYDANTLSTAVLPILAHKSNSSSDKGRIVVLEGSAAQEGDWIIVNNGDYGGILEVVSIDQKTFDVATTEIDVTFRDVFADKDLPLTVLTNATGTHTRTNVPFFGASGYTVSANAAANRVNITWNSGTRALFPRIRLKNGGWISFLSSTALSNATDSVILPDGLQTLATTGVTLNVSNTKIVNGINWTFTPSGADTVTINGIAGPTCNFSAAKGPALLYIEPKKWDDTLYGNFICMPMTTAQTTEIGIDTPVFNGTAASWASYDSDTYKRATMDKYGAFVTKMDADSSTNGKVIIQSPAEQMSLDVLFGAESVVVTSKTGAIVGGTVKSLGSKTVTDVQAASIKDYNLIVVGGSCVNSVAATLLGSSSPVCGADFTAKTGVEAGQFIIKTYSWGTDKVATLVAGFNSEDTSNAATYLHTKQVEIAVGKGVKGTTSTTATPLVEDTTPATS